MIQMSHERQRATLFERRSLWNSFVMVAGLPAWLALVRYAAPSLDAAFAGIGALLGTPAERVAVRALYARLPASSFSTDVLAARPPNLAVLPVVGVDWCDWSQPARVLSTLARLGIHPEWAERVVTTV
jgi:hypothetical protein